MKIKNIFFALSILIILSSCNTIVDLEDPLKGKITLVTDWSNRSIGIEQPASYTVTMDNQTLTLYNNSNLLPELATGTYPIRIYNTPNKISITGTTAVVATTGNVVDPLPGWLFTAVTETKYTDFKEETIIAVMQQQVRSLTIELTITEGDPERIASSVATLTGIANSLDYESNVHTGTNLSVSPVFTRKGNKLTAAVRLLGVTNETQKLTLDITFTDGRTQHIESNLSNVLANFNTNKHIPVTASANLNTPVETGFAATITGWETIPDRGGVAW